MLVNKNLNISRKTFSKEKERENDKVKEGPRQPTNFSKFSKSKNDFACNSDMLVNIIHKDDKNNKFSKDNERENDNAKEGPR